MRQLFTRISWPFLGLVMPEAFEDWFGWFRGWEYFPYIQVFLLVWLVAAIVGHDAVWLALRKRRIDYACLARLVRPSAEPHVSWVDLEQRFKALREEEISQSHTKRISGLLDAVTHQTNDGRQEWRLMGSNPDIAADAERLIRISGARLRATRWQLPERARRATTDVERWLNFIVAIGGHTRHLHSSGDGRPDRRDYWIDGIIGESAKACLECIARESAPAP